MTKSKITASVTAPDGLPAIRVLLTCKPKNQAEFDAIVEAVGGPSAFSYFSPNSAHATLSDGVSLIVEAYDGPAYVRPMAASITTLQRASKQ